MKLLLQLLSRACLLLIIFLAPPTMAAESSSVSSNAGAIQTEEKQHAIDTARNKILQDLKLPSSDLQLVSVDSHTWPDSSLGCAPAGSMSAQVVASGYIVTFASPKGRHVVHATEKYAVVCERILLLRNPHAVDVPLKNLDEMIDTARSDLAEKLHVQASSIRTLQFTPAEWPDTSMECAVSNEVVEKKATRGYRIALNHAGRTYVFHTDMIRVRACPAISAE